ncbi:unnamed protein product [Ostreobium quekettii]|uniref:Uncharacterized protein n=1 Tax=Ostreobium quekettii TaxID=121088 RepID=A0A8S1JDT3_9CHLO|nr:unnamed protein product [Ostreobium quekettii]
MHRWGAHILVVSISCTPVVLCLLSGLIGSLACAHFGTKARHLIGLRMSSAMNGCVSLLGVANKLRWPCEVASRPVACCWSNAFLVEPFPWAQEHPCFWKYPGATVYP